tara:strand:+ start:14 stop:211 length:198 start_codon:yes stop_codon:yes gene_type:complete
MVHCRTGDKKMTKIIKFPTEKRMQQQINELEQRVFVLEDIVQKLQFWRLKDVQSMIKMTNKEVKK